MAAETLIVLVLKLVTASTSNVGYHQVYTLNYNRIQTTLNKFIS